MTSGTWLIRVRSSCSPPNKLLISRGYMSVEVTTHGDRTHRELLVLDGQYENVCETLGQEGAPST